MFGSSVSMHSSTTTFTPAATPGTVDSALLGPLQVAPDALIQFLDASNGYAPGHQVVLLPAMQGGLYWMQSVESRDETFLLADPFEADPDFAFEIDEATIAGLQITMPSDVLVLAIVQEPATAVTGVRADVRAPIVVNVRTRVACQAGKEMRNG